MSTTEILGTENGLVTENEVRLDFLHDDQLLLVFSRSFLYA